MILISRLQHVIYKNHNYKIGLTYLYEELQLKVSTSEELRHLMDLEKMSER